MAHLPIWGPNADKPGSSSAADGLWIPPEELCEPLDPSSDDPASHALASAEASNKESDLGELAAQFSAHGGGNLSRQLSAELALEVVLNQIVEQALLATGATGAAIALKREDRLVCRATAGPNAPQLGLRLDGETGLSGACVRTHQVQRCDDAQADPRADMDASRGLGIRSVMILPLLRDRDLLGVFEVFSSRASAFGERDEHTLQALAQRALNNLQRAGEAQRSPATAAPVRPAPVMPTPATAEQRAAEPQPRNESASSYGPAPAMLGEPRRLEPRKIEGRKIDGVILALSAAVFACAVLLSTLLGLHFGWQKAAEGYARAGRTKIPSNAARSGNPILSNAAASPALPQPAAAAVNDSPGKAATPASGLAERAPQPPPNPSVTPPAATPAAAAPAGSLLIYENGREVFRMLPSSPRRTRAAGEVEPASSVGPAVELSPDVAEGRLLHRVQPEYPEAARRQGIQGPVVVNLRIDKDGAVQDAIVVSGPAVLAQAAVAAVKQWQFKPHYIDGREVETQTRITLRFSLPTPD